jgi:hypothetical protein
MKKMDFVLLCLFAVIAAIITIYFKTNLVASTFLFFGLPAVYLTTRNAGTLRKSIIFSLLMSLSLSLFIDILATLDAAWHTYTIFPFKFFGIATVENYLFALLWVLSATLFYEHFFDKDRIKNKFNKNIKFLVGLCVVLISATSVMYMSGKIPVIPYFYLISSVTFVALPLVIFLYYHPKTLSKFLLTAIYFFFLTLTFEIAALHAGQWAFPGKHFLGFVEIFQYRFPLEEFIFWMMLATPSLLAYYEFFADDRR